MRRGATITISLQPTVGVQPAGSARGVRDQPPRGRVGACSPTLQAAVGTACAAGREPQKLAAVNVVPGGLS
jgi:hypothetical protein